MDNKNKYVVFQFSNNDDSTDDILYDVGYFKWIIKCEKDMNGIIKWPPKTMNAGLLARQEKGPEKDWKEFPIYIKGYYDIYLKACQACNEYIKDSNYESESELGRGLRKKRKAAVLDSSDSEDCKNNKNSIKHNRLEKKIPSPPEVLTQLTKNTQYPKNSSISKQFSKKKQVNILQENRDKDSNSSSTDVCKSICEQNKSSSETATDPDLYNNYALLQKLEKVKTLKKQTFEKKKTMQDKKNRSLYNKNGESQKKFFQQNKKQNESLKMANKLISSRTNTSSPSTSKKITMKHSLNFKDTMLFSDSSDTDVFNKSSESLQEDLVRKESVASSLKRANKLSSCINTSRSSTPVKEISMEHSSSFEDSIRPNSPDTVFSKSSEFLQGDDLVQKESRRSDAFNSTDAAVSSLKKNSIQDGSSQSFNKEFTALKNVIIESNKETRRVSSKLDIVIMNQENLCRFIIPGGKIIKRPSKMPPLPINTLEELDRMEKFLSDDNNLAAACSYLGKNANKSVENSVRKILAKVLTNTLASKFSLLGHGKKRRFDALKLWDLVQGALLTKFEIGDIHVAEKSAATWLTNSSWRKQEDGSVGKRIEPSSKPLKNKNKK